MKLLYTDSHIVVVDKPEGLLAVPGRGPDKQDCLVSRVRDRFADMIAQPAVHRLDMQTSGVMILARTVKAHRHLCRQFEQRTVRKRYIAVLEGLIQEDAGRIELRFRLDIDNRPYQIYDPEHGKLGITHWRTLAVEENTTRVEFTPLTGRTHQLRIHAASRHGLGHPIVGDALYGNGCEGDRMMLHAAFIQITHPETEERLTFCSPAPF